MPPHVRAGADDDGRRLDRIVRRVLPELPLSAIHRLFRQGRILLDGSPAAPDSRVRTGQIIGIPGNVTPRREGQPPGTEDPPESRDPPVPYLPPLDILRETPDLLFLNKPAGLVVHGPESLDTVVQAYLAPKRSPSLSFRPGPLHRLDKPAGGVIVFSASLAGARYFSALLREGRIVKRYLALTDGAITEPAIWEDRLLRDRIEKKTRILSQFPGGPSRGPVSEDPDRAKPARTRVFPLIARTRYTLAMLEIDTGRTHQIRAQAAYHRHPLAGDRKYGGSFQCCRLLLHAWSLTLPFPPGEDRTETITAPIPRIFRSRLRELFSAEDLKNTGFDL
ncbi:MAG: RluA family pseudouridine synthase [Spirochaetaceae bacterium]|jgi:23S rRNA pseudouridine955/2504/2580 synthase|nr:RluA family pseudouridine synthase [Spirochaetaceae bacterium]